MSVTPVTVIRVAPDARERLLEAAISSLQEEGYARTTTRGIVARAGLHLPAVNYYFGSKDRLLQDAIVEALRRWGETTMSSADAVAAEGASPAEQLRSSLVRYTTTLADDRPYVVAAAEAFAQASRSEELRGRLAAAYGELRDRVVAGITQAAADIGAEPDTEQVEAIASTLIALFDGLALQWLIDPERPLEADRIIGGLAAVAALAATATP